jgi:hypothetical protein
MSLARLLYPSIVFFVFLLDSNGTYNVHVWQQFLPAGVLAFMICSDERILGDGDLFLSTSLQSPLPP